MPLDLSSDETTALASVLEEAISDLRMEIADTDQGDYRADIHRRKDLLAAVYRKLTGKDLT